MGYTTDFGGSLKLSRNLSEKEFNYINTFSESRRMKRDPKILMEMYKGAFGNPLANNSTPESIYGIDGEYFAKKDASYFGSNDKSIIDYNTPPGQPTYKETKNLSFDESWNQKQKLIAEGKCQPGLWCQWIVEQNPIHEPDVIEHVLSWDGNEKFYYYVEWLQYLIDHFFSKWDVKLNGEIEWIGEDPDDFGKIIVSDNIVVTKVGRKVYD